MFWNLKMNLGHCLDVEIVHLQLHQIGVIWVSATSPGMSTVMAAWTLRMLLRTHRLASNLRRVGDPYEMTFQTQWTDTLQLRVFFHHSSPPSSKHNDDHRTFGRWIFFFGIIPGTVSSSVFPIERVNIRKSEISLFTFSTNPTTKPRTYRNGGTYCNWYVTPESLVFLKSVEYFQAMSKVLDAFSSEKTPKKRPVNSRSNEFFWDLPKSRVADSENCWGKRMEQPKKPWIQQQSLPLPLPHGTDLSVGGS